MVSRFNSLELQFPLGPWHPRLTRLTSLNQGVQDTRYHVHGEYSTLHFRLGEAVPRPLGYICAWYRGTKYKGFFIGAAIGR